MHTKDFLAAELARAGLNEMASKAAEGYYHDFLSPLAMPETQLAEDLGAAGTPEAHTLRERHIRGEFDASPEESEAWANSPEGREVFTSLTEPAEGRNRAERRRAGERGKPKSRQQVMLGRLALRTEHGMVNAYYASPDTMEGAQFLGSVAEGALQRHERKQAFLAFMRDVVSDLIEHTTGTRPTWPDGPRPAPEHERDRSKPS